MIPKIPRWAAAFLLCLILPLPLFAATEQEKGGPPPSWDTGAGPSPAGVDAAVQMAQQEIKDPFATQFNINDIIAAPAAAPAASVQLEGIGLGGSEAYAVLGGEIYHLGEEKKGIKLIEARRGEVDISMNGETKTLRFVPEEELQKSKARQQGPGGSSVPDS